MGVLLFDVLMGALTSIKEIIRLIRKGMSNIYLQVTIEKKWRSQNFSFLDLKNSFVGKFLESSNSRRYHADIFQF